MTYIFINDKNSYLDGFDSDHDHAITDGDIKAWAKTRREYPEDLYENKPELVEKLFWLDTVSANLRKEYVEIFADDNCSNPFWKNIGPDVSPKDAGLIAGKMAERFSQRDKYYNEADEQIRQLADAAAGYPLSIFPDDLERSVMTYFFPEIEKATENERQQLFRLRNNVTNVAAYGWDGPAAIGIKIALSEDTEIMKIMQRHVGLDLEELRVENPEGYDLAVHNFDERVIYNVYPNTPAERAGLRKGDIITDVNGKRTDKMRNPGSEIYPELVGPCDGTIDLGILRDDQTLHFKVKRGRDVLYNFAGGYIGHRLLSRYPEILGK